MVYRLTISIFSGIEKHFRNHLCYLYPLLNKPEELVYMSIHDTNFAYKKNDVLVKCSAQLLTLLNR